MGKNWAFNKSFQEPCLKASKNFSKKFAQLIDHFTPFCKIELFEISVKKERKTKFKV